MPIAWKAPHVRSGVADHGQDRGDIKPVNAGQVHATQTEQMGSKIELWRIPATSPPLGLAWCTLMSLKAVQLALDFLVHFG